ncbi:Protein SGT1 [Ophiocordyceps camponoti-floridani]|uniref:Protein SGT1 n=1 Tax=Ophiocordyceps camponoti-floridani TaxID=2030778 RepID=A0A8H4Q7P8_9HYPO|nr:Protein SGT1 [Ophiocordyceps camponoti-floridani]
MSLMTEEQISETEEGFQNGFNQLSRKAPENCVEYWLFVLGSDSEDGAELEVIHRAAEDLAQRLTKGYIWQRDAFQLELRDQDEYRCLYGMSDYGDAVEDEWLIVYLLQQLTEKHENLWVRIADDDGEFLLIEAANVLPDWLSPETDGNRAWIHEGKLFLIPRDTACPRGMTSGSISLPQALNFIQSRSLDLVHSPFIQEEAFYRLGKYPRHISDSTHFSLVTIPRKLAFVLHSLPKSISPAVEYFYLRDPLSLEPIVSNSTTLAFPPQDLVTFEPPTGWQKVMRDAVLSATPNDKEQLVRIELGMKLTVGFEALAAAASQDKRKTAKQVEALLQELSNNGGKMLPSDEEIGLWPESNRNDDETWMNIDYDDFEREIAGQSRSSAQGGSGFGDAQTETDLRKIVSRFEAFLNDESAGLDGAEFGDSKEEDADDNTEESEDDEDSELEDKVVGFDEQAFSSMMRTMLGQSGQRETTSLEAQEIAEIQELSNQMENELRNSGALEHDDASGDQQVTRQGGSVGEEQDLDRQGSIFQDTEENSDVQIDYNLARNLLESFKGQAGLAGPTGNVLGMMGFRLPRDEDCRDNDD